MIEILVAIGILTLIASVGLVVNINFLKTDILKTEQQTILSALERTRSYSLNNLFQSPHGLCYIAPDYVIFRDGPGTRCVSGVSTNILIPANADIMGNSGTIFPSYVIFSQLAGTTTGSTIHLTDGITSADITINYEGTIIW